MAADTVGAGEFLNGETVDDLGFRVVTAEAAFTIVARPRNGVERKVSVMTTRASHRAGASLKAGRHAKPIGGSVEAKGVVVPAVRLEVEMDDVVAQGFAWAVRIETSSESEQSLRSTEGRS